MLLPGLRHHYLPSSARAPTIEVASGDVITIETSPATDGVSAVNGPVAVRGAQPGDVVELRIIDARFRPSVSGQYRGRSFGCQVGRETPTATIYELDGNASCAVARAIRQVGGKQEILQRIRIPLRAHFGLIALAAVREPVGERIDDARAGKGATLFLPVQVRGAMLRVGEPRAAATIESALTGVFQLILHTGVGAIHPLLETSEEWVLGAETSDAWALDRVSAQLRHRMIHTLASLKSLSEEEARAAVSAASDIDIRRVGSGWRVVATLKRSLLLRDCG
jgi:acetamidase/formamidase